jgi:hypothetical protein
MPMHTELNRRKLLLAGSALIISSCAQRDSQSARVNGSGGLWYVVQEGDSLSSLSRRSGLSIDAIIDANNISSPRLVANTRLWMPKVLALHADPLAPAEAAELAATEAPPATTSENVNDHAQIEAPPVGGYVMVPRSAWTSQRLAGNNQLMGRVTRITIHHTGEHGDMATLPDVEVIRRIEKYHRNERHWCAIGYHFIVGRDAKVYEGRPAQYQGAHVLTENPNNLGISVIGDFQSKLPTTRQLYALRAFLNDERAKYHVAKSEVYGHRELHSSVCPGDALFGWLKGTYRAS